MAAEIVTNAPELEKHELIDRMYSGKISSVIEFLEDVTKRFA
ncbi:MAG: hypothetical protein WC477_02150 [Patescibacteria group bacterium]